jgi:hypothetical protein
MNINNFITTTKYGKFWFDYIEELNNEQYPQDEIKTNPPPPPSLKDTEEVKVSRNNYYKVNREKNKRMMFMVKALVAIFNTIDTTSEENDYQQKLDDEALNVNNQLSNFQILQYMKILYNQGRSIPMLMSLVCSIENMNVPYYGTSSVYNKTIELVQGYNESVAIAPEILNKTITFQDLVIKSWLHVKEEEVVKTSRKRKNVIDEDDSSSLVINEATAEKDDDIINDASLEDKMKTYLALTEEVKKKRVESQQAIELATKMFYNLQSLAAENEAKFKTELDERRLSEFKNDNPLDAEAIVELAAQKEIFEQTKEKEIDEIIARANFEKENSDNKLAIAAKKLQDAEELSAVQNEIEKQQLATAKKEFDNSLDQNKLAQKKEGEKKEDIFKMRKKMSAANKNILESMSNSRTTDSFQFISEFIILSDVLLYAIGRKPFNTNFAFIDSRKISKEEKNTVFTLGFSKDKPFAFLLDIKDFRDKIFPEDDQIINKIKMKLKQKNIKSKQNQKDIQFHLASELVLSQPTEENEKYIFLLIDIFVYVNDLQNILIAESVQDAESLWELNKESQFDFSVLTLDGFEKSSNGLMSFKTPLKF